MKTRVAIYGGTNLSAEQVKFVNSLTKSLLQFPDVVIISGGFDHFIQHPERISVDKAVLEAAKENIDHTLFDERFETIIPKEADRKKVVRFKEGNVHEIEGSTQARRFKLVQSVDGLITIKGEGNTRSVIELALAINKPVLPVAFTGGDSKKMWKMYAEDIIKSINIPSQLISRLEVLPKMNESLDDLAFQIGNFIRNAIQKKCFILMPFGGKHDDFYVNFFEPIINKTGYVSHRIDRNDTTGNILSLFISGLETAAAVIVDITDFNSNVLYELGYVHAKKINPLIIKRNPVGKDIEEDDLPFYLKGELITHGSEDNDGFKHIQNSVSNFLNSLSNNRTISR